MPPGVWRAGLGQPRAATGWGLDVLLGALLISGLAAVARRTLVRRRCSDSSKGDGRSGTASGGTALADDPVTASGSLIAAWRAIESLEPDALFKDPLASALAGDALSAALHLAQPFPPAAAAGSDSSGGASDGTGTSPAAAAAGATEGGSSSSAGAGFSATVFSTRRFCYSNVGARCWWFDRQLAAALASPAQPRQVVVLGAGFDTRPWRLALPADVRWFELDMPEVVAAKHRQLHQLGAALDAASAAAAAHPLGAAAWAALPADLGCPGWGAALQTAGLDASQPTVWVAEGLLMYLDPEQAASLLREAADLSPPGSVLVAHNITFELLQLIQQDPSAAAAYAPFPPDLVATWRSGHALASDRPALAAALEAVGGWQLVEATSRARIAAQVCTRACGGEGIDIGSSGDSGTSSSGGATVPVEQVAAQVDFEARPDEGRDRWAVFFVANK